VYAAVGHGKCPEGDVFADLEAAKEACIAAGDCKAVVTQKNLCGGKFRVVHGAKPGLQNYPNGITTHKMRTYEATDLDCVAAPGQPGKPEKPEKPPAKACKWTLKKSYYAVAGHADQCPRKGTPAQLADLFDDLEDAKAACLKAGDCAAICKQNRGDICNNKWRVVHAEDPEWKTYPNGFKAVNMQGYEAAPECLSKCFHNNGGCHAKRKCTVTSAGDVTCGDCPAGYANDGAKGCKVTCKITWTRKNSYYATVGHGKCPEGDVFADVEDAKQACIDAGDCKAIATQKNLCGGKYKIIHSAKPGLIAYPNGITSHNMHAYEASDC